MKRMKLRLLLTCVFILVVFNSIQAQSRNAPSNYAQKTISFQLAEKLYLASIESIENGDPEKAIQHIERIIAESSYAPPKLYFFAGRAFHLNGQFYKALKHYKYYKTLQLSENNQEEVDYVDHLITQVKHGFEISYQHQDHQISSLQASLANNPLKQKYLMVSPKSNEVYFAEVDFSSKNRVAIYKMSLKASGIPQKEKTNIQLPNKFRPLQFYDQGNRLLLINIATNQLFTAVYKHKMWSSPIKMKGLPNLGRVSSASISDDGKKIVYARVFPDCDIDLYTVKQTSGKWGKSQALSINSSQQECFPNLTADGQTLYFSSGREGSICGFDIMFSQYNPTTQTWSKPQNMGGSVNTPYDELQFAMHPSGKSGVVLANYRQKGEKHCLYFFKREDDHYSSSSK